MVYKLGDYCPNRQSVKPTPGIFLNYFNIRNDAWFICPDWSKKVYVSMGTYWLREEVI